MIGLYIYCNPTPVGEDELAKDVFIKDNNTLILSPTIFWAQTSALIQVPAPSQNSALILGPLGMFTNVDLQRATKLALKLFVNGQEYGKANSASWDRAFKARNSDLYYDSSNIECYYFC